MKNNSRIFIICACCVIGGVALGVVVDRMLANGRRASAAVNAKSPQTRVSNEQESDSIGDKNKDFPDLAGLKTVAQWQAYIERWIAAGGPEKDHSNVLECLRRWAEADAEGALAFVHGAEKFPRRNEAYAPPLAVIGRNDMPRVIGWLQKNLPESDRSDVATSVIMALKDEHPQEALALAQADNIPVDGRYFGEIMQVMVKTNPADALRVLDSLPDDGKARAVGGFVTAWAEKDLNAALAWCAAQKGKPFADAVTEEMLYYLVWEKPSEIGAAVDRLGVTFDSSGDYGFMNALTSKDPVAALGILQKMPVEQMRTYGYSVVRELFKTDADQAVAAAQVIYPEGAREMVIFSSYQEWARSDRKAAEDWLAKEADSGMREQIKTQQLAQENPVAFLASISPATDLSGAFMSSNLNEALRRTADQQPSEALRWLLANPDQITEQRLSWLAYGSPENKVSVTAADIGSTPEDSKARESLINFASNQSINSQNWDAAADLLPLVTDPAKQDALRFKIFSGMMSRESDREAARAWLSTQPLSDEVRASWESLVGSPTANDDEVVIMQRFR